MDLPAAEGLGAKGPLLHTFGQISDQSTEQGHREPQSGDTPVTYCAVQSQQRHPLLQPPVLNIKAPFAGDRQPYRHTLVMCHQQF